MSQVRAKQGVRPRRRRWLRIGAWNVAGLAAALLLGLAGGEAWRRLVAPFSGSHFQRAFTPAVGGLYAPHSEVRHTNEMDFWTVSKANSLGFLAAEPPSPARAAAGCHIAILGDSFVAAKHVPIAAKLQSRLKALADERLPHLNVVTSAFGVDGTGQVNQLAYYDAYVRQRAPKLIVLVFFRNDFGDNFTALKALYAGYHPRHMPFATAVPAQDRPRTLALRPPSAEYARHQTALPKYRWRYLRSLSPWEWTPVEERLSRARRVSWLLAWFGQTGFLQRITDATSSRMMLTQRPDIYRPLFEDWSWLARWPPGENVSHLFAKPTLPAPVADGLRHTAFAFAEFQRRAGEAGAAALLLPTETTGAAGDALYDRMAALAATAGIDVAPLGDYIARQGGDARAARFEHDVHWNPQGHQWAAEAVLERLAANQGICDRAPPSAPPAATPGGAAAAAPERWPA